MMCTSSRINLGFACVTSNNPMTRMIALAQKECNPFLLFFLCFLEIVIFRLTFPLFGCAYFSHSFLTKIRILPPTVSDILQNSDFTKKDEGAPAIMKLNEFIPIFPLAQGKSLDPSLEIAGITDNSKEVTAGMIFVAIKGFACDGHDYIHQASQNGAALIVGEAEAPPGLTAPYIQVANSRRTLGELAKIYYQDPSQDKIIIGITGTNGKTTTAFFIKHLLEKNGYTVSLIGTIFNEINGKKYKTVNTTPDALKLHALIAASTDQVVLIEVSSHGLCQHRLEGITFDYALFNNLQHDHLDYHKTMAAYFEAKTLLFQKLKPGGKAVVNGDDEWGSELLAHLRSKGVETRVIGQAPSADFRIEASDNHQVAVRFAGSHYAINPTLPGMHNLYNITMASAVIADFGLPLETISALMASFPGVPGRYERMELENGSHFVVDYAHTLDALELIFHSLRADGAKRIIHIFGFRGKRDPTKWADMLELSNRLSNRTILTTDDLNGIAPETMHALYAGLEKKLPIGNKTAIILDRTKAIETAMRTAGPDDWILLTGKGHECYTQAVHYPTQSDKETVLYLSKLFGASVTG